MDGSVEVSVVDDYISSFPPEAQAQLQAVRQTIRRATPGAAEVISYGIPTFIVDGRNLTYLAGWKRHISLYPVPDDDALADELAPYRTGKGTLRFPLGEPIPHGLVQRVVEALLRAPQRG